MEPFLRTLIDVADDNLTVITSSPRPTGFGAVCAPAICWATATSCNVRAPVPSADMRRWAALGDHTVAEDVGYRDGQWRLATEVLRRR